MLPAIGGSVVMALGIAITPLAMSAAVLLLTTSRARTNGLSFLVGWSIALGVVGYLVLVILGSTHASRAANPAHWVSWLKIVIGLLLLLVAFYELRRRRASEQVAQRPRWANKLDSVRPPTAFGIGALLAGARPKNILLIIAGTAAISQTGISARKQGLSYLFFVAIATIGVAAPVVLYFVSGDKAPGILSRMEQWLARNSAMVTAVFCLVIGADLISLGLYELS